MEDEKIVLVARVKVKEDAIEEALKLCRTQVENSRAEDGSVIYNLHQAIDNPSVFVFYEVWKDKAALDIHFDKSYSKEFFEKMNEFAVETPQLTITKQIV